MTVIIMTRKRTSHHIDQGMKRIRLLPLVNAIKRKKKGGANLWKKKKGPNNRLR
jgi:hypothetical protein